MCTQCHNTGLIHTSDANNPRVINKEYRTIMTGYFAGHKNWVYWLDCLCHADNPISEIQMKKVIMQHLNNLETFS